VKKKEIVLRKHKGIIITATILLAAIAVVAGNRFVKNQDNNEKNSRETEKVDAAEQKNEVKKDTSLQKEATEISETTEITEAAVNTETQKTSDFYISKIPDDIFEKMQGKSYKADCTVPRDELRYVHVLHMGFDGQTKEGELVVNKAIADDVLAIFEELYQADYPIEKVELVDAYNADDEESMSHNNSSAFNFRFISHTTKISKHGLGMAVDINTLYNPYVKTVDGKLSIEPANATAYVDRSKDFPYKIDHDDLCYKLFTKYGFTWGGDWTHSKDYQHFERDY
jgi:hypothetical protein